jgi:hypothetical protein
MPKQKTRLDYEGKAWDLVSLESADKSYKSAMKALGSKNKQEQATFSLLEKFKALADGVKLPPAMWHEGFTEGEVTIWRMRAGKIRAYAWKSLGVAKTWVICHYTYKKTQATSKADKHVIMSKYRNFEE